MRRALLGAMLAATIWAGAAGNAQAQEHERLDVIELFTSQACSACPPADELLGKLVGKEGTLALSYSVDYWNYLEWEDTLAEPDFSARQRAYAKRRGDRKVYTPQMIVNGRTHAVGSDEEAVMKALAAAGESTSDFVPLSASRSGASSITIEVGAAPEDMADTEATLWLVAYIDSQTVKVQAGENKGRMLTYHNVVRRVEPIGRWRNEPLTLTVALPELARERCAILLQKGNEKSAGAILSAVRLPDVDTETPPLQD